MNFTMYIMTLILAYLGLAGGFALALIAPEELEAGKRYFHALKDIIFVIIVLMMMYTARPAVGIIVIIAIAVYLKFLRGESAVKIAYPVMGIIIGVFHHEQIIFPIIASQIFVFGLAAGTLCVMRHKKNWYHNLSYILITNIGFFITALPFYFLEF